MIIYLISFIILLNNQKCENGTYIETYELISNNLNCLLFIFTKFFRMGLINL